MWVGRHMALRGLWILSRTALICVILFPCPLGSLTAEGLTEGPPCDKLTPAPGPLGYAERGRIDHDDYRCEGTYLAPAAGEPVEVVAFFRAGSLPPGDHNLVLNVVAPSLKGEYAGLKVHAWGVATGFGTYYRMDTQFTPAKPLRWPVGVLLDAGLYPNGFGVLVWIETRERERLLVPVGLHPEGAPDTGGAPSLLLRAGVHLAKLVWRVRAPRVAGPPPWKEIPAPAAGQIIPLRLPAPDPASPTARLVVEVNAQSGAGKWYPTMVLQVLRP